MYFIIFLLFIVRDSYSQNPCQGTPVVIYDGKTYNTVQIGSQCWLKENLDVGTRINGNLEQNSNGIIEKYCYADIDSNCTKYGGLYQWNEAMQYVTTAGTKGICPIGWHIPAYAEYQALAETVNYNGNALKKVGQGTGGGAGTNTSGFTALLQGYRNFNGQFIYLGYYPHFLSSTETPSMQIYYICLDRRNSNIYFDFNYKECGFSVRCVKDEATDINQYSNNNSSTNTIELSQNYPNPFNPVTAVNYSLQIARNVRLSVYDILGNNVATVFDEYKAAGNYSAQFNGSNLTSGIYIFKLESGNYSTTIKFIIMK